MVVKIKNMATTARSLPHLLLTHLKPLTHQKCEVLRVVIRNRYAGRATCGILPIDIYFVLSTTLQVQRSSTIRYVSYRFRHPKIIYPRSLFKYPNFFLYLHKSNRQNCCKAKGIAHRCNTNNPNQIT